MDTVTVMATRANPGRAKAAGAPENSYQISHWQEGEDGLPVNLHQLDAWVPSMDQAVQWVAEKYPSARVSQVKNDVQGKKVVISYLVSKKDLQIA